MTIRQTMHVPKDRIRSVDIYFYEELLRHVGPAKTNEWLEKSGLLHTASAPSSTYTPVTPTKKRIDVPPQDILKSNEYDQNTECENDRLNPISSCSNVRSPLNDSGYLSALDIELTADAPENIGLLFTDAAHIVFNNSKRNSLRRKSTSSEHEDVE